MHCDYSYDVYGYILDYLHLRPSGTVSHRVFCGTVLHRVLSGTSASVGEILVIVDSGVASKV